MKDKNLFIMGLPEAGKTTYLAALWHFLNHGQNVSLKNDKLIGDQVYLAKISNKWADVEALSRTLRPSEKLTLSIQLKTDNGSRVILNFPDLSGESFQNQWRYREISKEHVEIAKKATGAILFIHPETIIEEHLLSSLDVSLQLNQTATSDSADDVIKFDSKDSPTQVLLVELLQFLAYIRDLNPLHIVIVISAWDLIRNGERSDIKPDKWLEKRLPLLWQYIRANKELFNVTCYGISAQGGKLDAADELLDKDEPCDRVLVVDQEGNHSNDITLPINWILNSDE